MDYKEKVIALLNSQELSKEQKEMLETIFPELKGNEDRKIRNAIYDALKYLEREHSWDFLGDVDILDAYTWLEKQGKQKPFNKVEPKFKEGDWVVFNGLTLYINEVVKGYYRTISKGGIPNSYDWDIDNAARLWTIEDAKDGDVLACNEELLLFKSYSAQNKRISLYCWYNGHTGNFHEKEVVDILLTTRNKVYPASKEQCELFFQKIGQAGYEWDEDKKELIKL